MGTRIKLIKDINYPKLLEFSAEMRSSNELNFKVAYAELMSALCKDMDENEEYIDILQDAKELSYAVVNFVNAVRFDKDVVKYHKELDNALEDYYGGVSWENYYDEDEDEYYLISSVYWNRMQWVSDALVGSNLSEETAEYFRLMNSAIPKIINLLDFESTDFKNYFL